MSTAAERPTGTVTFLFTDIEGSTRLLKELRDDYATALADHQRIIRTALAEHDGAEIDTQGDSFFAAFRGAKDAVGAAVDAQRALAAHEWPGGVRLRVRMGIHTGEPTVGGERYVGLGVHRAARIAAVGHGAQVLVSATTRELLRDDPPPDVSLQDLGEHQLKDMDEPGATTQTRWKPTAMPLTPAAAGMVRTTLPLSGSTRETVPSTAFATQTAPPPYATPAGPFPTVIVCKTASVSIAMRDSVPSRPFVTQAAPPPIATPDGPPPTSMV